MDFSETKRALEAQLAEWGFSDLNPLRIEVHVESLKDWSRTGSLEDLKGWFARQQRECPMTVEEIPLGDCRDWSVNPDSGWVEHASGDFFMVQGLRVSQTDSREVGRGGWDQPILTQVGYDGGLLGILRQSIAGIPHYLVEAKAEPGNPDRVQISPTLQATFSNLKRAHGGRKPNFAEYFESPQDMDGVVLFDQWMSEDGGRLHRKRNRGMLVQVPEGVGIELPPGFRWVSLFQLKQLIKENSWVNPHIRGIISHL